MFVNDCSVGCCNRVVAVPKDSSVEWQNAPELWVGENVEMLKCGNVEMWECGNVGMWKCGRKLS